MHRLIPTALVFVMAGLACPASAQNEDPYDLIRRLDAKLTEAAGLSYSAVREGHGSVSTTLTREGTVVASLKDGELRLRVEGHAVNADGSRPEFLSAYDGSKVTSIRHADKQVVTGELDYTYGALGTSGAGLTSWLLLWNRHIGGAFRDGAEPYSLEYDGLAVIDGEAHHTVRIGFDEYGGVEEYESWIYLDTDTLLPRRVEFGTYDNSGDLGMVTIDIDQMKLLETLDESEFSLTAPEDYEAVAYQGVTDPFMDDSGPMGGGATAVGAEAPSWSLEDPNGNEFALEDYRGKVVVMDFWATWCGPCVMAMPGLQELHEEFKNQPVSVVGINCWENGDPQAFMDSKGLDYQLLVGGDQVAQAYGVTGIPTFYVVGKDGKVVHHEVGFDPDGTDRLRDIIKQALAD